jgi:ABC-type multidrug transport system ATPase subunit
MSPRAVAPVLAAEGLVFSWPQRHVFTNASFAFGAGLSWVRGVNGSGKSTLLAILAGAVEPQAGRRAIRGIDAAADPVAYRREVFYCGPGGIAFDHLRPPEYFAFIQGLYPRFDAAALAGQVEAFGLAPHFDMPLAALSTGTQRKVWVAAALVVGSAAVLLDEPAAALDHAAQMHLHDELARHADDTERAWIFTSHEPPGLAGERASRVDLPPPAFYP